MELMSTIMPIVMVILGVFLIVSIIYVAKIVRTRHRIDNRFKQLCNEFEEIGTTVKIYQSSCKEGVSLLIKILEGKELIKEKEFPVSNSRRDFNLRLTRNEAMEDLLKELTHWLPG